MLGDDRALQTEPDQRRPVLLELLRRRPPFHRHERAPVLEQRDAPPGELVEPRHRPRGDEGRRELSGELLGPTSVHRDVLEPEIADDPLEPGGASQHRLDEVDLEVRPGDRQGHPRQTGS